MSVTICCDKIRCDPNSSVEISDCAAATLTPAGISDIVSGLQIAGTTPSSIFILPPTLDKVHRSVFSGGAFQVWTDVAIPAGDWKEFANVNPISIPSFTIWGNDAFLASKPAGGGDPPFGKHATPVVLQSLILQQPLGWPLFPVPNTAGWYAIASQNFAYGDNQLNLSAMGTNTQALPAGTWNCSFQPFGFDQVYLLQNGASIARWDNPAWVSRACPNSNWQRIMHAINVDDLCMLMVGVGPTELAWTDDGGDTWNALAVPAGWEAVRPRIMFTNGIFDNFSDGTFFVLGGKEGSQTDLLAVSLTGGVFGAPFLCTTPNLGANNRWNGIAAVGNTWAMAGTNGQLLIVGAKGNDVTLITNPGGLDAFDTWTQKTLAQQPF